MELYLDIERVRFPGLAFGYLLFWYTAARALDGSASAILEGYGYRWRFTHDKLREALLAAGLRTREEAESALDAGQHPAIAQDLDEHLRKWHWMRDRDLLFEPWDTRGRVIETALKTEPHAVVPYELNLQRNLLALSFHFDLAHSSGRALGLNHAARFVDRAFVERRGNFAASGRRQSS